MERLLPEFAKPRSGIDPPQVRGGLLGLKIGDISGSVRRTVSGTVSGTVNGTVSGTVSGTVGLKKWLQK